MGQAKSHFDFQAEADLILKSDAGKLILDGRGQSIIGTDGNPQTYFSATQEQRDNPYGNIFLGGVPEAQVSIIPRRETRDQERLQSFGVINGQAEIDTSLEELIIGGGYANRAVNSVLKFFAGTNTVMHAGKVSPAVKGNISFGQMVENSASADLTQAERNLLKQLNGTRPHHVDGDLREYVVDSYFLRNGFRRLEGKCGNGNCFDGVYVKNGKVIINEVKPIGAKGSVKLGVENKGTNLPVQTTDLWVEHAIACLEKSGNAELIETSKIIRGAQNDGNLIKTVSGVDRHGINFVRVP